ncbi:DUF1877 family protein [Streptomyces sp. NPDC046805]|uniref:DUF1877 family protein n=1 Tax=Streptomyces sp. NPDC046805 TaxID=3155134 RepID=UPI00340F7DE0
MSMWIYFQALAPSELPAEAADFEALFDVEFDELRRRVRAGDAVWLEHDFFPLNELYRTPSQSAGDGEFAVFGGRHIPDPGGGPGHVALDPPDVARAAAYLEGVSFPDLWEEWRQQPSSRLGEPPREHLARDHEELRVFYGRAAERGWAVARYFSF